jgi:hypothetical protein
MALQQLEQAVVAQVLITRGIPQATGKQAAVMAVQL